jgi:hypothetical protein
MAATARKNPSSLGVTAVFCRTALNSTPGVHPWFRFFIVDIAMSHATDTEVTYRFTISHYTLFAPTFTSPRMPA